jgi:hypothetical protein
MELTLNHTLVHANKKIKMKKVLMVLMISLTSLTMYSCSKDGGISTTSTTKKIASSVQCSGITQSGTRCKNTTTSSNGKCYLHGGN